MNLEEFLTLATKEEASDLFIVARASIDDESKWSDASHQ